MKKIYYLFLVLLQIALLTSCGDEKAYGQQYLADTIDYTSFKDFENNSLSRFHNDTLKLRGHLRVYVEDVSLRIGNKKIWISSFKPAMDESQALKLTDKNVLIVGLYNSKKGGHNLHFSGSFKEVYYIKVD